MLTINGVPLGAFKLAIRLFSGASLWQRNSQNIRLCCNSDPESGPGLNIHEGTIGWLIMEVHQKDLYQKKKFFRELFSLSAQLVRPRLKTTLESPPVRCKGSRPDQTESKQRELDQTKLNQVQPNLTRLNQTKRDQTKLTSVSTKNLTRLNQTKPN